MTCDNKRVSVRPREKTKAGALGISGKPPRNKCTARVGSSVGGGETVRDGGANYDLGTKPRANRLEPSFDGQADGIRARPSHRTRVLAVEDALPSAAVSGEA